MSTPSLRLTAGLPAEILRVPSRPSTDAVLWSVAERILAGVLLIALLPLLTVTLSAVALVSRKSPLIGHRRLGRHGREFWMLKIRTMWDRNRPTAVTSAGTSAVQTGWIEYISDAHVPVFKGASDPRVTSRLALLCRRFSLDELPQLIHVLKGGMRLVGPRQITRAEWNEYYGASAADVLSAKPRHDRIVAGDGPQPADICATSKAGFVLCAPSNAATGSTKLKS